MPEHLYSWSDMPCTSWAVARLYGLRVRTEEEEHLLRGFTRLLRLDDEAERLDDDLRADAEYWASQYLLRDYVVPTAARRVAA